MGLQRKGTTTNEVKEMQNNSFTKEEKENVDIVIILPDGDELTENERIDEDQTDYPQATDVARTLELN